MKGGSTQMKTENGLVWKHKEKQYESGHALYVGAYRVGETWYNSCRARDSKENDQYCGSHFFTKRRFYAATEEELQETIQAEVLRIITALAVAAHVVSKENA